MAALVRYGQIGEQAHASHCLYEAALNCDLILHKQHAAHRNVFITREYMSRFKDSGKMEIKYYCKNRLKDVP